MAEDRRPDSAMGPSSQPGEAEPPPAERSAGLGGSGTEGKPGAPEGGTEPQLPRTGKDPGARHEELMSEAKRRMADPKGLERPLDEPWTAGGARNAPVTGVGAADGPVAPAGLALGGDAGDVGTPRDEIGGSRGGTHGATSTPQASSVVTHGEKSRERKRRRAA